MKYNNKNILINRIKNSNIPEADKEQIIRILVSNNLEKSLSLILQVFGAAETIIKIFSQ